MKIPSRMVSGGPARPPSQQRSNNDIPVAVRDAHTLRTMFADVRAVLLPGSRSASRVNLPSGDPDNSQVIYTATGGGGVWKNRSRETAWVVSSPDVGDQLWVDMSQVDPSGLPAIWQAAFGKSVPVGYRLEAFSGPPQDKLVVVAVIGVLIGLLTPAVPGARGSVSPEHLPTPRWWH